MMAPDVVVMETSAEAAELLAFRSAGGILEGMCCLPAARGGTEASGSGEVTLQNGKQDPWCRFLGEGIATQQPNTFHPDPKKMPTETCVTWSERPAAANWNISHRWLSLSVSVSAAAGRRAWQNIHRSGFGPPLQRRAPGRVADVKREENQDGFVGA